MAISISGLSNSGLDTTSIIEQLMEIERIPLTTLETKKSNLQSQQSVFRSLNTRLNALQTAMADLQYNATFEANKATSSKSGIINATANTSAATGSYNIEVLNLTQVEIQASAKISGNGTDLVGTDLKFSIPKSGGSNVELTLSGATNKEVLDNLVSQINSHADIDATAKLIDVTGEGEYQLVLTADKVGANNAIQFSLNGATSTSVQEAKHAKIKYGGVEISRSTNNFDDVISGVKFEAQGVGATTLTVGKDTDGITGKINTFVSAYNNVMEFINLNLAKAQDENSINPLQGDSTLKALKDQLYNVVTQGLPHNGKFGYLEEIGVTIGADVSGKYTGLISFDQDKLKNAIQSDPSKVETLFVGVMTDGYNALRNNYTSSINGAIATKISGYDSQIKTTDERMERLNMTLEMKQARLKVQFSAMESALASLNSTQSWLTTQFNSLTKSSS